MKKATWIVYCTLVLAQFAILRPGIAQDNYPTAPIRLVVGFQPGGSDVPARLLAQKLSPQMNTPVIVDNKPGANGNIGAEFVAKSKPDGYTLLFNTSGVITSRALGEKMGYDVLKDLVPVSLVVTSPDALIVNPSLPVNTVHEFIAHVRANPGKLTYGSGGIGNITHLVAVLFLQANGLSAIHVPYKGAGPAVSDLVAGHVQFATVSPSLVGSLAKEKRLKILAITSLNRAPLLPDVPTLAETVMPGFDSGTWYGVMAPASTPPAIVRRLNMEIARALRDPDIKSRFDSEGLEMRNLSVEEYGAFLRKELDGWTKVIKSADIKPE